MIRNLPHSSTCKAHQYTCSLLSFFPAVPCFIRLRMISPSGSSVWVVGSVSGHGFLYLSDWSWSERRRAWAECNTDPQQWACEQLTVWIQATFFFSLSFTRYTLYSYNWIVWFPSVMSAEELQKTTGRLWTLTWQHRFQLYALHLRQTIIFLLKFKGSLHFFTCSWGHIFN